VLRDDLDAGRPSASLIATRLCAWMLECSLPPRCTAPSPQETPARLKTVQGRGYIFTPRSSGSTGGVRRRIKLDPWRQ
jgi:hypothetical protein